ncbi:MAG: MFS transporter family glucose-6-phosphate receptor UhpC [Chlamydiota bacterium]
MSVLDLLKPAPNREKIQDEAKVKKEYKYWRLRTFYGMYIGYAFYYFTRKSFTFAMPAMIRDLGFDKAQLGMLGSILAISYGVSKFLSGIISDRSNPRYFMGIGLILTGIFNIFFGLSSVFWLFALFWGLNGWFQGWGWPPCAKLLTHWYSQSERGRWWSIWSTSHNLGGAIIPIVCAFLAQSFGWRYALYVPGLSCIFIGFFIINRLRDTPESLGLPNVEKFHNEPVKVVDENRLALSSKEILVDYVLKNKFIWVLAISYFFVYVIRQAVNDWLFLYLIEKKGYSMTVASSTVFWFEVGGFFGILSAGWFSDKIFRGRRGPVNALFSLCVIVAIILFWKNPGINILLDSFLMGMMGFFVFGPQMLIGIAAAELSHKKAAGTATGFAGTFAYLGAAMAGGPLGWVTERYGWEGFFVVLTFCGVMAFLILLPLWTVSSNPKMVES